MSSHAPCRGAATHMLWHAGRDSTFHVVRLLARRNCSGRPNSYTHSSLSKRSFAMELIICDDEPIILSSIKNRVLKEYPDMHVKTYTSPKKLLANKDSASIYLLDVEMKEMSGLELAAQLRQNISKKNPQPIIIFITGYPAHMQKAFDVQAFHYLLKPLDDEKFSEVLSRAVTEVQLQLENATDYIMIKSGSAHTKLALDDIIFIESNNKKMIVHTTDTVLETYGKMQELESMLIPRFFRSHRCYLVNLAHVITYDHNSLTVTGGQTLYLAKNHYGDFITAFMNYAEKGGVVRV